MKSFNSLLIFIAILSLGSKELRAQNVTIPDANFKNYLVGNTAINTNGDSEIQLSEAQAFSGAISCSSLNIADLTGIEAFVNLTELSCAGNNLTSLNLTQNTNLTYVYCAFNNLNNLDLTQNTNLIQVICYNNNLSSLDVSQNVNLQQLHCKYNPLTSLDLSQNTNLIAIDCWSCNLNSLNLKNGNNINMTAVYLYNNPNLNCVDVDNVAYATLNWTNIDPRVSFSTSCGPPIIIIPDANFKAYLVGNAAINTNGDTEIQVSEAQAFSGAINCSNLNIANLTGIAAFTNLTALNCNSNNLTSLNLTQNSSLVELLCTHNNLTSLDVTQNTGLTKLHCSFNPIRSLNLVQNSNLLELNCQSCNLNTLDVRNGNNTAITNFNAINNPNLSCIGVDNSTYSTTNWTNIDTSTSFSSNCSPPVVRIPDANFKAYLVGNTIINTNGDAEIQFSEALAYRGTINCRNRNIADLTGIEAFIRLSELYCNNNNLTSLDLTQNTNLTILNCVNNSISSLDVTQSTYLRWLFCSNNPISSLNLTPNVRLERLYSGSSQLSSLDLTQNVNLKVLDCSSAQLSSLKLKNGNNTAITTFKVTNNPNLNCIEVDNPTYSTTNWTNIDAAVSFSTNCSGVPIVTIPDANFKAYLLGNAAINTNGDTEIQVTEAQSFNGVINCAAQNIANLTGIEAFVNLTELYCNNNNLASLDVTQNTNLAILQCHVNNLTSLELSQNTNLTILECHSNNLSSLNVKNGNNTAITTFNASNNPNLSCIDVDNSAYATTNWTNIDATASFSTNCSALNVHIPDVHFKTYLVANTAINTNGDTEIQVTEAQAFNGVINCAAQSIADLTGIEAFVNLTQLRCNRNNLTSLDVSQNTSLTQLYCYNNRLTSLNVGQNTNLTFLHCVNNNLSSLDVSQNTSLTKLYCDNNSITSLDLRQNTNLIELNCRSNNLNSLNIKNGNNTNITIFSANNNPNLSCIEVDNPTYSTTNWTYIDATVTFSTNCSMVPPIVHIPDANFKAYLVANTVINTNGDAEIQVSEAQAFNGKIDCYNLGIGSFTGIEAFVNLTELDCSFTGINNLDLTQNAKLEVLDCSGTGLSTINVGQNINLKKLSCTSMATSSSLTSLDVTQNINLEWLTCDNNALTSLDLTKNIKLTTLYCYANQLNSLNLSQNTNLGVLDCSFNQLNSLNLRNGNNTNMTSFDARNNPNLSCITVDNSTYSTTNWTNIDATASFSTNCGGTPIVNIPDANFKAYLVANTAINTNGDTEIQVSEAQAFSGVLNCSAQNIADLTGIEAFINLTQLRCHRNNLTSLDLSQNTNLVQLYCYNNNLTSLDVTQNTSLVLLHCVNNSISSLDLSQNTNLTTLYCSSNTLTSLDLTQNTSLTKLYCANNNLNSLNVKNGNNTNVTGFSANGNPILSCITVDNPTYSTANWTSIDATASFSSNCNMTAPIVNIPDANFKACLVGNTAINTNGDTEIQVSEALAFSGKIDCSNKNIADLTGIEAFTNLTQLICYGNNLSSLDVTQNTSLVFLHCVNNSISNLDVTQNTNLTRLYCSNNPLSSLDLRQNTSLARLYCSATQLNSLDIRNGNNTNITTFDARNNPNLSCITVDNPTYSTTNWTNIDATASFSSNCSGAPTVSIPDANFKAYLLGNTVINTNGDTEIQVSEASAFSGMMDCSNRNIADLTGIEAFTNLIQLNCHSNNLSNLDLTQNTNLGLLNCSSNQLNSLDLKNGNNVNMTSFDARNNPNLICIAVDNPTYSTTNWINIDATASFSASCGAPIVLILDANFKAYLVGNTAINTNGDTEIQVSEALAFSGKIDCSNKNIADLTGIEAFVNLTQLICYRNNLSSLDVTQNTSLVFLHCVNNSINNLDVTQNTNLTRLYCSNNPLSSLDLRQNANLARLYCSATQLNSLDIRNGNNANITTFDARNNPNLSCIAVDNPTYSTTNWTNIDATASFSNNCTVGTPMANIPDGIGIETLVNRTASNNTSTQFNSLNLKKNRESNIDITNRKINLRAYPNPTTRKVTLDFGQIYQDINIQITNLTGQIVLNKKLESSSVATVDLESSRGVYFINIQTEAGNTTIKVIKE